MALTEKDFEKQIEDLKSWILSSVPVFAKDTEKTKLDRIERARTDKVFFAQTYFPHYCVFPFCDFHLDLFEISDIYNVPVVAVGFRGLAKSTIVSFIDELHKTLFKINRFTMFVCDTQETAASEFLLPIKAELEENPRILHDFGGSKTSLWTNTDFVTKSGKRFLALGPKMGVKGKKNKGTRPDRIIVEDFENINSPKKKSQIMKRIKFLLRDLGQSVNFNKWQFIFLGNYFSKKTCAHYLLTSDECKHWIRRVYPAIIESAGKLKSAWEACFPLKILLDRKAKDPRTFRSEMEQKPDDDEAMFREEWIKWVKPSEIDLRKLVVATYYDPSAQKGEEHCKKAIITIGVDIITSDIIVLNAWIRKTSKWDSIIKHFEISRKYKAVVDGVEGNGFQFTLQEDYEKVKRQVKQILNLQMVTNYINKEVRIGKLSSPVQRGNIKFLDSEDNGDMKDLVEEMIDFPDGEYKDGVDALSGAVEIAETYILKITNQITSDLIE